MFFNVIIVGFLSTFLFRFCEHIQIPLIERRIPLAKLLSIVSNYFTTHFDHIYIYLHEL